MMENSNQSSNRSSSVASNQHNNVLNNEQNKSQHSPLSEYDYVGRIVTREGPNTQTSHRDFVTPSYTHKHHHSSSFQPQEIYAEVLTPSDDNIHGLSKPYGIIKVNDRHIREIYRLPTPPPQRKKVFHRAPSPEPRIIERVFVRPHTPEIIENIVQVPPEKVRIINREKYLKKSKPVIKTKVIRLQPYQDQYINNGQQTYTSSEQYVPQQQQQSTIYTNPIQIHSHPVSFTQSIFPSQTVFHSQPLFDSQPLFHSQPLFLSQPLIHTQPLFHSQPLFHAQPVQSTTYSYILQ